jgi:hypothetical protein
MTERPGTFPADLLKRIDEAEEVRIETNDPARGEGATRRTIIWIVVDKDDVFIRSVRGDRGAWYKRLLADPRATLHVDREAVPVRGVPATDADSIERTSRALQRKYAEDPALSAMLRPQTFHTAFRLEPA